MKIVVATLISSLLGLTMIGGALYWRLGSTSGGDDGIVTETTNRSYTLEELVQPDGKDGNGCLAAVDGEVYQI